MRCFWKKCCLIIVAFIIVIVILGNVLFRYVYFPGINFFGPFVSTDAEMKCYWYDDEAKSFTGEVSNVKVRVMGFKAKKLYGVVQVEGHEMDVNNEIQMVYGAIGDRECYIRSVETYLDNPANEAKSMFGYTYLIRFDKANLEYAIVNVSNIASGERWKGYCGMSLEAVKEYYMK